MIYDFFTTEYTESYRVFFGNDILVNTNCHFSDRVLNNSSDDRREEESR